MNPSLSAKLLVYIPTTVLFLESIIFLVYPFILPKEVLGVAYPQLATLVRHCSVHRCLYDPSAVASIYALQLMTLVLASAVFYVIGRNNRYRLDSTSVSICAIVILGTLLDYSVGNFAFHKIWILPNTVTTSPLGLFRYAILFSLASICAAVLASAVKPKEPTDANS